MINYNTVLNVLKKEDPAMLFQTPFGSQDAKRVAHIFSQYEALVTGD
jgi:hypothetical protein